MDVSGADLYSAFTLLLYKEEMGVIERKDPAEEWKRSQPWLAVINPASDKSLTQQCCRTSCSWKGLIPKACFLLQSSQILICMKMDFRRRREKTAPWPPHFFSSQSQLKNILIIDWQFSQAGQLMEAGEAAEFASVLWTKIYSSGDFVHFSPFEAESR